MSITSQRERRLWLTTAFVVTTIYATLGLTPKLLSLLEEAEVAAGFSFGMLLVGLAVMATTLNVRPRGIELGVLLGVGAVYVLTFVRLNSSAERSHLIEYSVVAALIAAALQERASNGRPIPVWPLIAIVATTLIGTVDECIQLFLPNRVFDSADLLFNFLASVMAVLSSVILHLARTRLKKHKDSNDLSI